MSVVSSPSRGGSSSAGCAPPGVQPLSVARRPRQTASVCAWGTRTSVRFVQCQTTCLGPSCCGPRERCVTCCGPCERGVSKQARVAVLVCHDTLVSVLHLSGELLAGQRSIPRLPLPSILLRPGPVHNASGDERARRDQGRGASAKHIDERRARHNSRTRRRRGPRGSMAEAKEAEEGAAPRPRRRARLQRRRRAKEGTTEKRSENPQKHLLKTAAPIC